MSFHTEHIHDLLHVVQLDTSLDEILHALDGTLDCAGNLINILRFDDSLEVILQNLGEIIYFI